MPDHYGSTGLALRSSLIERLNAALTPSSRVQYKSGIKAFLKFLSETDAAASHITFPLSPIDSAIYTEWLLQNYAPGSVRTYRSHLNYFCDAINVPRPQWDVLPQMKRVFREANKLAKRTKRKKLPITTSMACTIVNSSDLTDPCDLICCLVLLTGVMGLFRLGELLVKNTLTYEPHKLIRKGHISFHPSIQEPEYFQLFLQFSKTDKYGVGVPIYIPCNSNPSCCPVLLMREWVGRFTNPTDPIFCWPSGRLMTTSSFISWLRRKLRSLGIDDSQYAGHSLRRGGAVSAKAAGASDLLIKTLGRWTSDSFMIYLRLIPPHVQNLNDMLAHMKLVQNIR